MKPNFLFFRACPPNLEQTPPLASSLQSLETCFLLLSSDRYPHALLTCVTAIESAIRAQQGLGSEDKTKFRELLDLILNSPLNFKHTFTHDQIRDLCEARNRIVHYGFSPHDDDPSVRLLLKTGFPLLNHCYKKFFDFYIDWRDVRLGVCAFHDLTPDEMAKVGLVPEFSDALDAVRSIYNKSKQSKNIDLTYCMIPLVYRIRHACKGNYSGITEDRLILDEGSCRAYEAENEAKEQLEKAFMATCPTSCFELDCPICGGLESIVAQIDDAQLERMEVSFKRAACVRCGLFLPDKPFLTNIFLYKEITARREKILHAFGLN
jgi:hypothetical protein